MAKAEITFASIPARAVGDQRLKGLHLKVLGAVAPIGTVKLECDLTTNSIWDKRDD